MSEAIHITTAIFYCNAPPHVGSAYEALAADVFARHQRRKRGKDKVTFLTGTDEHGDKLKRAALAHGMEPKAFSDRMSAVFRDAWRKLNVSFDFFVRTTDPWHEQFVQQMLKRTYERGDIYFADYQGLYCVDASVSTPKKSWSMAIYVPSTIDRSSLSVKATTSCGWRNIASKYGSMSRACQISFGPNVTATKRWPCWPSLSAIYASRGRKRGLIGVLSSRSIRTMSRTCGTTRSGPTLASRVVRNPTSHHGCCHIQPTLSAKTFSRPTSSIGPRFCWQPDYRYPATSTCTVISFSAGRECRKAPAILPTRSVTRRLTALTCFATS